MAKNTPVPAASKAAPGTPGDVKAAKVKTPRPARTTMLAETDERLKHDDPRIAGHDRKLHKNLTPKDFTSKSEYMRFRALFFDKVANRLRADADKFEKMGSIVDNKKAKRLLALSTQIEALKASLADEGQDVAELLKSMGITI